MISRREIRDSALLDLLGAVPFSAVETTVWRIVRHDRDPLRSSSPKGRWDDGTFDVLYTSLQSDGARAEMYFHIMRGQPVFPSGMEFRLFKIQVKLKRALNLMDGSTLSKLGIDMTNYGMLSYARKDNEYTASQKIGEAAHFLDADSIIVPNARWSCSNAILFPKRLLPENLTMLDDCGAVNWSEWKNKHTSSN